MRDEITYQVTAAPKSDPFNKTVVFSSGSKTAMQRFIAERGLDFQNRYNTSQFKNLVLQGLEKEQ
jgi:hypothetical protein